MYQKSKNSFKHIDFVLIDAVMTQVAFLLAYYFRQGDFTLYEKSTYQNLLVILAVASLINAFFVENYKNIMKRGYLKELVSVLEYVVLDALLMMGWLFFIKESDQFSRSVLVYYVVISIVTIYLIRNIWKVVIRKKNNSSKGDQVRYLVVTHSSIAEDVIRDFSMHQYEPTEVVGLVNVDDGMEIGKRVGGVEVVSKYEDTVSYIQVNWVDAVYIKLPIEEKTPEKLLNRCATMGVTTCQCIMMETERSVVQSIDKIAGNVVLVESMNMVSFRRLVAKRVLDIIGGFVGVMFTALLAIIVGPIIYFTDPGPILFSQNRVGKSGRIFRIYKFRSMYKDAEKRKKELMDKNTMQGLMFKMDDDPRILGSGPDGKKHGIGWFIRKTSIDEFPQFWNVLKGEMSLVGTRPPTVDEWEQYKLHHRARLAMKPGITGLWQTSGRSEITDFEDVIKLDLEYINNWTIAGDLRLILKTIGEVFKPKGAK